MLREFDLEQFSRSSADVSNVGDSDEPTVIQRFYSGANVFVTGATGFLGKLLIEKLLRSCPDIEKVYILVREKRGKKLEERIQDLLSSTCFERIAGEHPEFRSKVHAIAGDIGMAGLGMSEEDRNLLAQEVDVVFHVAATVRFDEHLKLAILQNVRGTKEVLNLSKTFRKLRSVIHVSTAYSNCPGSEIKESVYDPPFASDHIIHLAETHDLQTLEYFTHKLLGKWHNTYAFTKGLSEDAARRYGQGLPIAIFRPSIVIWTSKEPIAGWIDNLFGPAGVLAAIAAGLMRTLRIGKNKEANLVPGDLVTNALIASAWDVAENRFSEPLTVYNYVCPRYNPITWHRYQDTLINYAAWDCPPSRALWYPFCIMTESRFLYNLLVASLHLLPAFFLDLLLLVTRRKTMLFGVYAKLYKFDNVASYFPRHQWDFEIKNVEELYRRLGKKDKKLFSFNMDHHDWYRYIFDNILPLRYHLLGDPPENLPQAKINHRRRYILHRLVQLLLLLGVFWFSMEMCRSFRLSMNS